MIAMTALLLPSRRVVRPLDLLILLALLTLLGACAGRDYVMPPTGLLTETEIQAGWSVDRTWWKAYRDPVLDRLVDTALRNNVDLAKSAIAVNRALYQARQVGADLVPDFSGGADASASLDTKSGDSSESYGGKLGISYEVDLWRKLRDAASAQEWEYKATEQDRESARLALINNVIDAYYNLQYLRQAQAVTRRSIAFYEELYRIVDDKYRAGKVDGLEPITAEQSLLAARNNLMDLERQQKTGEQTLRNLLNLGPDAPLDITAVDLLAVQPPAPDLDAPLSVLGLRPDVRAAEYRIQEAFNNWEADKAGLYPSLTLGGSLSVSSNSVDTLFNVPFLGGTLSINLPFLQWNKVKWNVRISETQFEERKLDFAQTLTTALNEVDTYWYSYQNALALLANMEKKHQADVRISAYRETRYNLGADELKDWVQARNTENDSMLSVLKGKYNVIEYVNAVFQAMGGRLIPRSAPAGADTSPPQGQRI